MNEETYGLIEIVQRFMNTYQDQFNEKSIPIIKQFVDRIYCEIDKCAYQLNDRGVELYFKSLKDKQQNLFFTLCDNIIVSFSSRPYYSCSYTVNVTFNEAYNSMFNCMLGLESLLESSDWNSSGTFMFSPLTNSCSMNFNTTYSNKCPIPPARKDRIKNKSGYVHDTLFVKANNKRKTY